MAEKRGLKKFLLLLFLSNVIVYIMLQYSDPYRFFCDYFKQQKYPTETNTCLHNKFRDILLVVAFNFPLYESIPILLSLYKGAFPNIYFCGTNSSTIYPVHKLPIYKGYFAYECISEAIFQHKNYTGYLFLMDDVLLNFWTLQGLDTNRLWEGPKQPVKVGHYAPPTRWYWWRSRWGRVNCQKAFDEILFMKENPDDIAVASDLLSNLRQNGAGRFRCHRGRSDIFYIPKRLSNEFIILSSVFRKHEVFLEIAVPTIFRFLDKSANFELLDGHYLPGRVGQEPVTNPKYFWSLYSEAINFIHPLKLHYGKNSTMNFQILRGWVLKKVHELTSCTEV